MLQERNFFSDQKNFFLSFYPNKTFNYQKLPTSFSKNTKALYSPTIENSNVYSSKLIYFKSIAKKA